MKNKFVAFLLAFFLGGFGAHKFYLGKPMWGIVYLVLCWTYIPSIIAFVEGLIYLCTSDKDFQAKYGEQSIEATPKQNFNSLNNTNPFKKNVK